jgi:hypothetical protein
VGAVLFLRDWSDRVGELVIADGRPGDQPASLGHAGPGGAA